MTLVPGSEDEIFVKADRQRLIQVLLNILTNASRYNRPGGKIEVNCSIADNGTVRIAVKDTGFGIKESVGHKLFQPFERLGETTVDGTGLGLALSRRLMRLMNGELSLEQTSESGSTFTVEVGHAQRPAPIRLEKECESTLASGADNRIRVVYIDDNFSNVHLLERVFEKVGGVEFLSAMQASIGIQLIEEHMPDLVLLDLHLPDMSGLEALRILRSNPATAQIPVIMVSADATDGQIRTLLEAGAKAYLTKPIDIGTLFSQVTAARAS